MSLISIAQRETFHISFVQFANKDYGVDLLTPESKVKCIIYYNRKEAMSMELYIGGYAQGKLSYVSEKHQGQDIPIVNHLHLWVKQLIEEEKPAEEIVLDYYREHPDCIFICDEIGNGIVPMDQKEREYRERVGRLLITLAKEAKTVERIVCGIGQKIK